MLLCVFQNPPPPPPPLYRQLNRPLDRWLGLTTFMTSQQMFDFFKNSDINECLSNNGGCHQNCHDSDGSYTCSCNDGYQLNSDRHTCKGIPLNLVTAWILDTVLAWDWTISFSLLALISSQHNIQTVCNMTSAMKGDTVKMDYVYSS